MSMPHIVRQASQKHLIFRKPSVGVKAALQQSITIMDGVFAVNKPQGVTSAQVIRDLQEKHFDNSDFFAPHLADIRRKRAQEQYSKSRARRDRRTLHVKMGHGGTLDPLATGVLILGVGDGTKAMQSFIGCTKSYETVVLFGAATDTYDITGKVTIQRPWDGVTKESVTEALTKFKGKISQRPPVYSALWINGRRAYDIAREGGEVPEMKEREVEVTEMELVEWLDPGQHGFHIPSGEISVEQAGQHSRKRKRGADAANKPGEEAAMSEEETVTDVQGAGATEGRSLKDDVGSRTNAVHAVEAEPQQSPSVDSPQMSGALKPASPSLDAPPQPPAARIRMTVSSGFYVRSLCHDLGETLGSAGNMASLVRTRQGEFELGKNVLETEVFDEDETTWSAKLKPLLKEWNTNGKVEFEKAQKEKEDRGRAEKKQHESGNSHGAGKSAKRKQDRKQSSGPPVDRGMKYQNQRPKQNTYENYDERRNSSSEED